MELILVLVGLFTGSMSQKTYSYCECFRDDFKGAYCTSIKGDASQGSCKIK